MANAMLGLAIVACVLCLTRLICAQDPGCDYQTNVEVGQTYYVFNKQYPGNYTKGTQCRWIGKSPQGYRCRLKCTDIDMPQTPGCYLDRLLVSQTGDPYLTNGERYCGRGTLSILSIDTAISVGLIVDPDSPGGRVYCTLTAESAGATPGNCQCGYKKTNRIVGGTETGVNEYPMMVGLIDTTLANQIYCGGVIITPRAVSTAAHCLLKRDTSKLAIVVGEHDVSTGDSSATKGYRVDHVVIHPEYDDNTQDNDIALVFTAIDIQFSNLVGPACLPFKFVNTNFAGQYVTALGWGTTSFGGPTSNTLQKVSLQVISNSECRTYNPQFLSDRQMCTYSRGKDTCQYDSGGPLLYTDPATGLEFHLGVVSSGRYCASDFPAVSTRVTRFLAFIQANTPGYTYCVK